jgi:hypothetical protein
MPSDQHMPYKNFEHLRIRARTAPLCYSRPPTSDGTDQGCLDTQSNVVLAVLSAVTCAATFLVVYGGWVL